MVCKMYKVITAATFATITFLVSSFQASALPFNDDMVHSKNAEGRHMYYSTGQIMRSRPEGSISVGMNDYHVKSKEEAEKLENPKKGDKNSWKFGKRLFQAKCSPCHGNIESNPYESGMAVMPAVGWKLSPNEHWDVINYIRHVQSEKTQRTKDGAK